MRFWTVWRFSSPLSGETKIVAKIAEPNDRLVQHEYQRVLWQGSAFNAAEALGHVSEAGERWLQIA
jgi:hypothetical protein